jgi:ATP-dependent RNA helicase SUPV3L1/SUV3
MHPGLRVYVVYGSLPPEARQEQARLFNHAASQINAAEAEKGQGQEQTQSQTQTQTQTQAQTQTQTQAQTQAPVERGQAGTVLIASDAIGMGLNLSIRRIVMSTLLKFDGMATRVVTPSELKQVGIGEEYI